MWLKWSSLSFDALTLLDISASTMPEPDSHEQVALLLCESLLHLLVEQRVLSREAALNAIESVLELTEESTEAATLPEVGSVSPTALIERIAATFAAKD
jgi:hypothetical protein